MVNCICRHTVHCMAVTIIWMVCSPICIRKNFYRRLKHLRRQYKFCIARFHRSGWNQLSIENLVMMLLILLQIYIILNSVSRSSPVMVFGPHLGKLWLWLVNYKGTPYDMPLKSTIHLWSPQYAFEAHELTLNTSKPLHTVTSWGLIQLPHSPHACAPQWVPIVWCVSTGLLYVSASCSTVYKSSPLAGESLEFSLWISFVRLVILLYLCCLYL